MRSPVSERLGPVHAQVPRRVFLFGCVYLIATGTRPAGMLR